MFTDIPAPSFKNLRVHQEGDVLYVDLFRPEAGNTLTGELLDELLGLLAEVPERPDIRVLVLAGAGEDFSLGADLKEMRELVRLDPGGRLLSVLLDKGRRVCEALEALPVVTIARLHGRVTGASVILALSCDLRAAADTARFRMPELAFNLVPTWGGSLGRLIAAAGEARSLELLLTCAEFDAHYARSLDLVQLVESYGDLDAAITTRWIRPLQRRPAEAVALTKRLFALQARSTRAADLALLDSALLGAQLRRWAADSA